MVRVLIVAPWARVEGGAERMLATLIEASDRTRLAGTIAFLEPGPLTGLALEHGFDVATLDPGRLRDPRALVRTVRQLRSLIDDLAPDVVLGWMAKCQLYAAPAARLSRTRPAVAWWQHMVPETHWMDRIATRLPADLIGASSAASADAQLRLRPRRAVRAVHPGIDAAPPLAAAARARLRDALGIGADDVVLTIVGRLQAWKRQDVFLRVLHALRSEGLLVHGLVVGGDSYDLEPDFARGLVALAEELEIGQHVTFTGHREDVPALLEVSDVFVSASEAEPFGIVLIEALAAGVPVVAVDAGGPREILADGGGRLAAGGSPAALLAALRPLVADVDARTAAGRRGREVHRERFSAERMGADVTALLEEAAGR